MAWVSLEVLSVISDVEISWSVYGTVVVYGRMVDAAPYADHFAIANDFDEVEVMSDASVEAPGVDCVAWLFDLSTGLEDPSHASN